MSPMTSDADAHRLLGKQVRVQIDIDGAEKMIVEGQLLGFGDGGDFEILCDDGMVYHAWPMLTIKERSGDDE